VGADGLASTGTAVARVIRATVTAARSLTLMFDLLAVVVAYAPCGAPIFNEC
jgi:hypothetical protein